ncbi:MAG: hypothetical protein MPL62_01275 [Alphaproteobacteria bacterium]|nr:hypothetical protein [Alphaproteobacteria bacterium]
MSISCSSGLPEARLLALVGVKFRLATMPAQANGTRCRPRALPAKK